MGPFTLVALFLGWLGIWKRDHPDGGFTQTPPEIDEALDMAEEDVR